MSIFTKAFLDLWEKLPEARASMRVHKTVIDKALCEGRQAAREQSDYGQYPEAGFFVRCLLENEDPLEPLKLDQLVDVQFYGSEEWTKFRIAARKETTGILNLTMVAPNE